MDKITQLWIRACKSKEPMKRCESVLRRFYCVSDLSEIDTYVAVSYQLCEVVEDYIPMTVSKVLSEMHPRKINPESCYEERYTWMLINQIRCTRARKFEGLTSPLRFRK